MTKAGQTETQPFQMIQARERAAEIAQIQEKGKVMKAGQTETQLAALLMA